MSDLIGRTFSHYKIMEQIGQGGMGMVYKARDTSLKRDVALKFLPPHLTSDELTRKRFKIEAQAASALDHPNICTIHEINETEDGQLYICMAYYEGQSLREKLNKGALSFEKALHIFNQIALGLKAAHDKGIIHRDIKPGNILLTKNDEVRIVDFGLAKLAGMDLTKTTSSKGTAAYMCPEQIRGEKVDQRCDIWALGIVLYEMLTGHLPFLAEYPEPMMYAIVNEEPKKLAEYFTDTPENLQAIIDKLLIKDPKKRYQNIEELLIDKNSLAKGKDIFKVKPKVNFKKYLWQGKYYILSVLILFAFVVYSLWPPDLTRIAIIPVKNEYGEKSFTLGMADGLITKLSQIGGLHVIGSFTSQRYLGTSKTTSRIASELGVQYILEISSGVFDDQAHLNARLLDARRDEYLLTLDYNRNLKNIIGLYGLIAKEVVDELKVKPTPNEEIRLSEKHEVNPETYKLYTEGMRLINQGTFESIEKGVELLKLAIEKDPNEPLAHAHYALGLSQLTHSPMPRPGAEKIINESALRALELNNNLAEAHLAMAMVKIYGYKDIIGAEQSYRKAIELNPNLPLLLYHYAWFQRLMGNFEEGPKLFKKAIELEPLSAVYPDQLALMYYVMEEYDQAEEYALKAFELNPDHSHILFVLGAIYAQKSMYEKAIELQKKSVELTPFFEWSLAQTYVLAGYPEKALEIANKLEERNQIWDTWGLAVIYGALKDADKMFYWLNQAEKRGHIWIMWMGRGDIWFGDFKEDPRYQALAQKLNFPK